MKTIMFMINYKKDKNWIHFINYKIYYDKYIYFIFLYKDHND